MTPCTIILEVGFPRSHSFKAKPESLNQSEDEEVPYGKFSLFQEIIWAQPQIVAHTRSLDLHG
jgi:hypothetical protein